MHTINSRRESVHIRNLDWRPLLSEDGGRHSEPPIKRGAGFRARSLSDFGQCVHKIVRHEDAPGRLYMQNHGGWADWTGPGARVRTSVCCAVTITATRAIHRQGIASDFGFPIVVHPHGRRHSLRDAPEGATRSSPAARRRCGAAKVEASRGAAWRAACRRRRVSSPSSAMPWTSTGSRPRALFRTTTGQFVDSGGKAVSTGTACSIRCPDSQRQGCGCELCGRSVAYPSNPDENSSSVIGSG